MRILHCIHSLAGGGAERQLKLLVSEANKKGEDYAIFCVDGTGNDLPSGQVKIYTSKRQSKITVFKEIQHAIDDFLPEVIHAWLPSSVTIPAMFIGKWNRIPVVFSYRNTMKFSRPLMVIEYLFAWIFSKGIVSNNPINASKLQYRLLYYSKIHDFIPNAVKIDPKYKKTTSHNHTIRNIIFVGRLTYQKNWQCLINALPKVIQSHSDIRILIYGDGEDKHDLITLVKKLELENYVSLLGYEKDIYKAMHNADVLILPSWYEGMPNVFLEALEIGLPCIVSDIYSNVNLLNNTKAALLFKPDQPSDLSEKLNTFLSDDNHNTMIKKGWEIASIFTPNQLARRYISYYNRLI